MLCNLPPQHQKFQLQENTTIIHVVPVNQDLSTISTWFLLTFVDTVSNPKKVITVFTKADANVSPTMAIKFAKQQKHVVLSRVHFVKNKGEKE